MKQPEGFTDKGQEHLVCTLVQYIWFETVSTMLESDTGYTTEEDQSTNDPCIYTSSKEGPLILAVYVDDTVLAGKSEKKLNQP